MSKCSYRWRRLISARWEDSWVERLRFLGPNLVRFSKKESRFVRLEAWCDKKTGLRLVQDFGGVLKKDTPTPTLPKNSPPILVRDRFEIRDPNLHLHLPPPPKRQILWIPASTAFGTGSHATTLTLLRTLCDLHLTPNFRAYDAGTGTGILAIALEKLGAAKVVAVDNDPAAVAAARKNVRYNRCNRCQIENRDALSLQQKFDLITANLFSSLLIQGAGVFAQSLEPNGLLLFSGVLRSQWQEVCPALECSGFHKIERRTLGKWCAGIARASNLSRG